VKGSLFVGRRGIAMVSIAAVLVTACAIETRDITRAARVVPSPPAPARNTAAAREPLDALRFDCAVEVQRAEGFDPGAAVYHGTLVGALAGGALGAPFGALAGAADTAAVVGGGIGMSVGGPLKRAADSSVYERRIDACLAAHPAARDAPAGLVEYRLRILSVRHDAFVSFVSAAELAEGASGAGLDRLAGAADAGDLDRGTILYDRQITPVSAPAAHAFGAARVTPRIRYGGAGRDLWSESRWYGVPGERTVWTLTSRTRRPQEVRRIVLSDRAALAQFGPLSPPLFGAKAAATVTVPLATIDHATAHGSAAALVERTLDQSRAITVLIGRNDDLAFPDRVYAVVTHASSEATYEAVLAWAERIVERGD
jgi:uncharacterized protein YcfJ